MKEKLKQAQNNRDDETLKNCFETIKTIAQKRNKADKLINDEINPRLKKVEENIEVIDGELNSNKTFRLNLQHIQIVMLIIVAIIAVVGIVLPKNNSINQDVVTESDVKEMIDFELSLRAESISEIKEEDDDTPSESYNFDGGEVTFIDISGNGTVAQGHEYILTARKGSISNRKNLTTGGGEFIIKFPEGNEEILISDDCGITAPLRVEPGWSKFCITYRFNGKEFATRHVEAK